MTNISFFYLVLTCSIGASEETQFGDKAMCSAEEELFTQSCPRRPDHVDYWPYRNEGHAVRLVNFFYNNSSTAPSELNRSVTKAFLNGAIFFPNESTAFQQTMALITEIKQLQAVEAWTNIEEHPEELAVSLDCECLFPYYPGCQGQEFSHRLKACIYFPEKYRFKARSLRSVGRTFGFSVNAIKKLLKWGYGDSDRPASYGIARNFIHIIDVLADCQFTVDRIKRDYEAFTNKSWTDEIRGWPKHLTFMKDVIRSNRCFTKLSKVLWELDEKFVFDWLDGLKAALGDDILKDIGSLSGDISTIVVVFKIVGIYESGEFKKICWSHLDPADCFFYLWGDIAYFLTLLAKSPGFTAVQAAIFVGGRFIVYWDDWRNMYNWAWYDRHDLGSHLPIIGYFSLKDNDLDQSLHNFTQSATPTARFQAFRQLLKNDLKFAAFVRVILGEVINNANAVFQCPAEGADAIFYNPS